MNKSVEILNSAINDMDIATTKFVNIIYLFEFVDMMSFFGLVSVLVLYLTYKFSLDVKMSYALYGVYLSMYCSIPVIGGFLNDKFVSTYSSLILGSLIIIIGNFIAYIDNFNWLIVGLSFIIVGTAFLKTSCTSIIGQVQSIFDEHNEKKYSNFYIILNCGAIIGSIIYGVIAKHFCIKFCFLFSGISFTVPFALILFNNKKIMHILNYINFNTIEKNRYKFVFVILLASFVFITFYLYSIFSLISLFITILILMYYIYSIYNRKVKEKNRLIAILILLSFCVIFFAGSLQVGSSLTIFVNNYVNAYLFSYRVPTEFFASLDPLFLVLTAPMFSFIWLKLKKNKKEPSSVNKLVIGLFIGSLGFLSFFAATKCSFYKIYSFEILFLVLGYLFIGAGEICFAPAIINCISKYSPKNMNNIMIGSWYFFMAIASYFSVALDDTIIKVDNIFNNCADVNVNSLTYYSDTFFLIAIITFLAGAILLKFHTKIDELRLCRKF